MNLFGYKNPEFNPKYDELIAIYDDAINEAHDGKNGLIELGLAKTYATQGIYNSDYSAPYFPVSQEEIFIDKYDEIVTHHTCTICGESYDTTNDTTDSTFKGDLNNDGICNVLDLILLQKWLLCIPDTHLENWKAADLYEDGRLDIFDFCCMKRLLLEKQ